MNDLWQRLRQRKLVQWAVAYVAAAFALLQGVDIVAQQFAWADSLQRGITLAMVLGFFVTLVLAWYHGERGEQKVSGTELLLLALLLAIGGGLLWKFAPGVTEPASAATAIQPASASATASPAGEVSDKSIAVLPFTSMSAGQDDAYFADGLSEETINALSRVPDLRVAARTSSFAFRSSDKTIPQIARELRVATVLEGSVRRAGERLRMTAQLIRAADGFELWSETYDRSSTDVIAIQEDVARSIAQALKTATDPEALVAMQRSGTRSVPAYQSYVRGLALLQQANQETRYDLQTQALAAFNQATMIDPGFADANARAADLEWWSLRPSAMGSAEAATSDYAQRLQRLQDDLERASTHARNPEERNYYDALRAASNQRFMDALDLMRRYVRAYPNIARGHEYVSQWSLYLGDFAAARTSAEAMGKLQSRPGTGDSPVSYLVWAGDGKRAGHFARADLQANPRGIGNVYQVHRGLLMAGAIDEAAGLVPQLVASGLEPLSKTLVQVRQACAEGRVGDANRLAEDMASVPEADSSARWNVLQLLGRTQEADGLLAYMDTPAYFNALSSFLVYPYFDITHFPNLEKVLLEQGVRRPPPRREPFACAPEAAKP